MRKALLIAGSTLALAIAAPAFAQTSVPAVAPAASLAKAPVVRARLAQPNRPAIRTRGVVRRAPLVTGNNFGRVKAPTAASNRVVRVHSGSLRHATGLSPSGAVKPTNVRGSLGHGQDAVSTKKLGVPLTAANRLGGGHALAGASNLSGAGKALGGSGAGKALGAPGRLTANVSPRPGIVTNPGHKH